MVPQMVHGMEDQVPQSHQSCFPVDGGAFPGIVSGEAKNSRHLLPCYLDQLQLFIEIVLLVAKCVYVHEHNTRLPHSAFQGQTPDEMYFQNGDHIPQRLETARQEVRQAWAEANRKRDCGACELLAASRN